MYTYSWQATWAFVIIGNSYDIAHGEWRVDGHTLLSTQELWFAVFMTVLYGSSQPHITMRLETNYAHSICIPWVTLREVPVDVEIVSYTHVAIGLLFGRN
jgi:hypothetical protein